MRDRGIQGPLWIVLVVIIVIILVVTITFLVAGGYFKGSPETFSVEYTVNNANQYMGKEITVQGFYEGGVITDVPTNMTYQVNNWDASNVILPVNISKVSYLPLNDSQSYYFTGTLENMSYDQIYPMSTVVLNVSSVKQ